MWRKHEKKEEKLLWIVGILKKSATFAHANEKQSVLLKWYLG